MVPATETLLQGATQSVGSVGANYTAGGGTLTLAAALLDPGGGIVTGPFEIVVGRNRPLTERRYFVATPAGGANLTITPSPGYLDNQNFVIGDLVDIISAWETQRRLRAFSTLHTHVGGVDGSRVLPTDNYGVLLNNGLGSMAWGMVPQNALANPSFNVWQRGTNFIPAVSGTYTADCWMWQNSTTAVVTINQSGAGVLGQVHHPVSLQVDPTTADASIAAGEFCFLEQSIEGYYTQSLAVGGALSFWVYTTQAGTYCVAIRNKGNDRSYIAEYTHAGVGWEYKTITFPALPYGGGTWGNQQTDVGLRVAFVLASGSTYQTTPNAWQTGNFLATANQVNFVGDATKYWHVTGVNLIAGSTPQLAQPAHHHQQLARCLRYYQRLVTGFTYVAGTGQAFNTTQAVLFVPFLAQMGGTPSLELSAAGDFYLLSAAGGTLTLSSLAINAAGLNGMELLGAIGAASLVAGNSTVLLSQGANSRLGYIWNPT